MENMMSKEQQYMTKEIEKIIGEQLMAIANMRVQIRLLTEENEQLKAGMNAKPQKEA